MNCTIILNWSEIPTTAGQNQNAVTKRLRSHDLYKNSQDVMRLWRHKVVLASGSSGFLSGASRAASIAGGFLMIFKTLDAPHSTIYYLQGDVPKMF